MKDKNTLSAGAATLAAIMAVARANGSYEDDDAVTLPDDFEEVAV